MKGKVRGKTIMRARAAVLQFWLSSFPQKILFICSNIAHLDTFCGLRKLKTLKSYLVLHIKNLRHHFSIV